MKGECQMAAVHGKKHLSQQTAVKRGTPSARSSEIDLSHIFESFLPNALVMQQLAPYKSQIATLKKNKISMRLLATKLIDEGKLDIGLEALTQALEEFEDNPARAASAAKPKVNRPSIPAVEIQQAVEKIMRRMRVKQFTVRDRDVIDAVVGEIPALASFPRHERNRKIIDAFIKRTKGVLIVRINKDGQREIAFAV